MEKKKYQKPTMRVYPISQGNHLLVGSQDGGPNSYTPSLNPDGVYKA